MNPSVYGQPVTFTAVVTTTGTVPPTGAVNFTWSGYSMGSASLNTNGVATLTKFNLNADPYPLIATYKGDANNAASTSPIVNQVVKQASSTLTLTSSPNPSTFGQIVTFTAKVSSPTVIPRGPVTFRVGNTVLGTVQLSNGKATIATSSLPLGTTKVTATYAGDSNITRSAALLNQTVQ